MSSNLSKIMVSVLVSSSFVIADDNAMGGGAR